MAIYIVDGKIGSGKTYYVVYYVLKKYYAYDAIMQDYFPKKPVKLITNIDQLKLEHVSLELEIEKIGLEGVFSKQYVENLRGKDHAPVVFIVDEAQSSKFFHRKYYNEKVFFLFQYSRHYGLDIFLIVQDADSLARELKNLPEYTIHAVSRSNTAGINFEYKKIINDEVVSRMVVPIDKKVFGVYRSFNYDESEKPKPVYLKYLLYIVGFALLAVLSFKYVFLDTFMRGAPEKKTNILSRKQTKSKQNKKISDVYERRGSAHQPLENIDVSKVNSNHVYGYLADLQNNKQYRVSGVEGSGGYTIQVRDGIDPEYKNVSNVDTLVGTSLSVRAYEKYYSSWCRDDPGCLDGYIRGVEGNIRSSYSDVSSVVPDAHGRGNKVNENPIVSSSVKDQGNRIKSAKTK